MHFSRLLPDTTGICIIPLIDTIFSHAAPFFVPLVKYLYAQVCRFGTQVINGGVPAMPPIAIRIRVMHATNNGSKASLSLPSIIKMAKYLSWFVITIYREIPFFFFFCLKHSDSPRQLIKWPNCATLIISKTVSAGQEPRRELRKIAEIVVFRG